MTKMPIGLPEWENIIIAGATEKYDQLHWEPPWSRLWIVAKRLDISIQDETRQAAWGRLRTSYNKSTISSQR